MQLPNGFFYIFGAMLIVFGSVRAYALGWKIQHKNIDEGPLPRSAGQKRHLLWGVMYVGLGLFLIISTYVQALRAAG